jgi:polyhydroxyalkanoate synthesis regulator phasin
VNTKEFAPWRCDTLQNGSRIWRGKLREDGKIMRKALFALLAMVCVCPACIMPLCQDTVNCVGIVHASGDLINENDNIKNIADSVKGVINKCQKSNDSLCRIINNNITVETITKSQEFYGDAFDKIQSSYNIFLFIASILLTIAIAILSYFNHRERKVLEIKVSDYENNSTKTYNHFEKWFKNEIDNYRVKFENERNEFKIWFRNRKTEDKGTDIIQNSHKFLDEVSNEQETMKDNMKSLEQRIQNLERDLNQIKKKLN